MGAHVSTRCLLADARCGLSFGAIRGAVGSFFSKRVTGAEVSWGRLLSLRDPVAQPPRYLGEGWRGSPRPSHNNEKQSMGFVKSSANDLCTNRGAVRGRAALTLRSVEAFPQIGRFVPRVDGQHLPLCERKKNSGEAMAGSANKKKITSVTPRQFIAVFDEFLKGLVQMITPLW